MPTPPWSRVALLGPDAPLPIDRPFTYAEALAEGVIEAAGAARRTWAPASRAPRGVRRYAGPRLSADARAGPQARGADHGVVVDRTAAGCTWSTRCRAERLTRCRLSRSTRRLRVGRVVTEWHRASASSEPVDIEVIDGLRVTTKLRTACDVGRLVWRYDAIGALDGLVRAGVAQDELLGAVARFTGVSRRAATAAARADHRPAGGVHARECAPVALARVGAPVARVPDLGSR